MQYINTNTTPGQLLEGFTQEVRDFRIAHPTLSANGYDMFPAGEWFQPASVEVLERYRETVDRATNQVWVNVADGRQTLDDEGNLIITDRVFLSICDTCAMLVQNGHQTLEQL